MIVFDLIGLCGCLLRIMHFILSNESFPSLSHLLLPLLTLKILLPRRLMRISEEFISKLQGDEAGPEELQRLERWDGKKILAKRSELQYCSITQFTKTELKIWDDDPDGGSKYSTWSLIQSIRMSP